jgi:ribose transport system ATP-binding protein
MVMPLALDVRHVSKTFSGVRVLSDLSLTFESGQVHALLGQNGAGKSTFVKILAGYHSADEGSQISVWGEQAHLTTTNGPRLGIGIVHQDLPFADGLSVIDNLGAGPHFDGHRWRLINWRAEEREARQLLDEFEIPIDPRAQLATLTPAERAVLNIARTIRGLRMFSRDKFVLVLDEPTSYLSQHDSARVLQQAKTLAERGCAIIVITHRIKEALRWADSVSVLSSGHLVGTRPCSGSTVEDIELMMFGTAAHRSQVGEAGYADAGATPLLEAKGISGSVVTGIDFRLRRGQVIGFAGLVGMGQDELPYLLFGDRPMTGGELLLDGRPWKPSPHDAVRRGVVLVPGNRQRESVWLEGSALENLTLINLKKVSKGPFLLRRKEREYASSLVSDFSVVPPDILRVAQTFSGGNQQKLVLARILATSPEIVLLHEPTQGVDAASSRAILDLAAGAAMRGAAVAVFSSDAADLAQICSEVSIVSEGRISRILRDDEIDEDTITAACHRAANV